MAQFILFNVLIFLDVVLVCQTFLPDAAECELFQVSISNGEMCWTTKKHISIPGRGKGHRWWFFRGKVA